MNLILLFKKSKKNQGTTIKKNKKGSFIKKIMLAPLCLRTLFNFLCGLFSLGIERFCSKFYFVHI